MKKFDLKNWTNTLKILFDDGTEYRLPDISYDKFENSELYKSGSSDIEYDKYLREQIRAVHDAKIKGYLLWNARQVYTVPFKVVKNYYKNNKKNLAQN